MRLYLLLGALICSFWSCSNEDDQPTPTPDPNTPVNESSWLIPTNDVFDGGPGKDGIPSIDQPTFEAASTAFTLTDDELVVGIKVGDEIRAYPHYILDWHEIVNDELANQPIALTYCPLTGTAIGWDREINGTTTTFGVSGLLYNSNLMPYDRATNSTWSQMRLDCVNGDLIREEIGTIVLLETSWKTWRGMFPSSLVMTPITGFNRDYGRYPYGNYKTSEQLLFPVNNENGSLSNKERVLGVVIGDQAKVYPINDFADSTEVLLDEIDGTPVVVVGNREMNFAAAFVSTSGTNFTPINPTIGQGVMEDDRGNTWNAFGEAVAGPDSGSRLAPIREAYIGFWFSWVAFHPTVEIYLR